MPVARITHTWPDGNITEVATALDEDYPDALNECRVQTTRMYQELIAEKEIEEDKTLTLEQDHEPPPV